MSANETGFAWRATRTGEMILRCGADDVGNVWLAKSGKWAGYVWSEPAPAYFGTQNEALAHVAVNAKPPADPYAPSWAQGVTLGAHKPATFKR